MRTHFTIEDIEKYMDTSDFSEEYLLWMEEVTEHLDKCEKCQKMIDKAIAIESVCREENLSSLLKLAEQEEEIRRSIVICKLVQMYQQDATRNAVNESMADVIRQMQMNEIRSYVLQVAHIPRYAGVSRGEDEGGYSKKTEDGVEITIKDGVLQVKKSDSDKQRKFTAVLDCHEGNPMVCEALWNEESQQWIAQFNLDDVLEQYEVYIII